MDPILFGVFLPPSAAGIDRLRAQVQTAESTGFDYVSIRIIHTRRRSWTLSRRSAICWADRAAAVHAERRQPAATTGADARQGQRGTRSPLRWPFRAGTGRGALVAADSKPRRPALRTRRNRHSRRRGDHSAARAVAPGPHRERSGTALPAGGGADGPRAGPSDRHLAGVAGRGSRSARPSGGRVDRAVVHRV